MVLTPTASGRPSVTHMVTVGGAILAHMREGRPVAAGRLMSEMDRDYAEFNEVMNQLDGALRSAQSERAKSQRRVEYVISGLVVLMAIGAAVWGNRLSRELKAIEAQRRSTMAEMERASHAALESARLKSEFLSNMNHEIRTPMNGVIGVTSLLLDTPLTEDQKDLAHTIRRSGDALLAIINDVLDFSKIEAGKLELESIDFDLQETVDEVLDLFAQTVRKKKIELVAWVAPDIQPRFRGDPGRLRQVLTNLVGNAVKFTDRGEVVVHVTPDGNAPFSLRVEVRDTGIGLSKAARSRLFQSFTQADGSTTRQYGGTGLGLAISKRLVELMGGAIGADSVEASGSTFWFTVRLAAPEAAAGDPVRLNGLRVLVVDDHAVNLRVLESHLSKAGIAATCIQDPFGAIDMLLGAAEGGRPYDLAILDQLMPGLDGLELTRRIRSEHRLETMPIVIFSSSDAVTAEIAREAGAQACLAKPVGQRQALRAVANLTRRAPTSPAVSQEPSRPSLGLRVLVAEDNGVNQMVTRRMLERLGCAVEMAGDGAEAIAALTERTFDLVFMDCHMPNLDGFAATTRWREIERTRGTRVPILALSASAMAGDRQTSLDAGMDDHISKPVKLVELQRACEQWATRRLPPATVADPKLHAA